MHEVKKRLTQAQVYKLYEKEMALSEQHCIKAAKLILQYSEYFGYKNSFNCEWARAQLRKADA